MEELEDRIETFDILTVRLYLKAVNIYRDAKEYERKGIIDPYWVKFNYYTNTLREYYDTLSEEEKKRPLLADEILALSLKYVMYCSPADYVDEASDVLAEKIFEGSENFMYVKDSFYTRAKEEGLMVAVVKMLEKNIGDQLSNSLFKRLEEANSDDLTKVIVNSKRINDEEDVFLLLE